ncbi:ly6/PLAUR domain-containing protein 1-like [Gadus chalcogrammus]|uniref:ly6/PLAUR domain-containing protein 1-like n=1 Tax=Gadus chalcogrammus TaxID=1042646 RepID=UPI0024C3FE8F|nr:ly6/PLAUR domain-containing protein 1-like [Gadus chalcogrammus]
MRLVDGTLCFWTVFYEAVALRGVERGLQESPDPGLRSRRSRSSSGWSPGETGLGPRTSPGRAAVGPPCSDVLGAGLQIQCYQCEEAAHDCSLPDYVVNCTVNVQDTCQQEVLVTPDGVHYRKSCASSGACLISSSGYQQFCTGRLHSVCISCCSQPLCNGPRRRRSQPSASSARSE